MRTERENIAARLGAPRAAETGCATGSDTQRLGLVHTKTLPPSLGDVPELVSRNRATGGGVPQS